MIILYDDPSILPGEEASLTGLLIHVSPFRGQLIGGSAIQSKDGTHIPPEIHLRIAEKQKLIDVNEWVFVVCGEISIRKTDSGGSGTILTCYQAVPKDGWKFGSFDSCEEVEKGQNWINAPLKHPDIWVVDKNKQYTIELHSAKFNTQPCVYDNPSVLDIIAKIEHGKCAACEGQRYICPGCPTGAHWLARQSDAFIEWKIPGVSIQAHLGQLSDRLQVVCPLCIGLGEMYADKKWHKFYGGKESTRVGNQRAQRCNQWFEALGY